MGRATPARSGGAGGVLRISLTLESIGTPIAARPCPDGALWGFAWVPVDDCAFCLDAAGSAVGPGAADASTYVEDTVTEKTVAQFITDDMSPETRHVQPPPPTPHRGRAPGSRGTPSLQAKPSSPASSKMDDEILDRLVKLLSSGCSIQLACTEV